MGEEPGNEISNFVKTEMLRIKKVSFAVNIIIIVVGYFFITLWLNKIRAVAPSWLLWVLIITQLILYFLIFFVSYKRSKELGFNKDTGFIVFILLATMGRINDWEVLLIPLLVIVILMFPMIKKKISTGKKSSPSNN